jgi:hypothetical protein
MIRASTLPINRHQGVDAHRRQNGNRRKYCQKLQINTAQFPNNEIEIARENTVEKRYDKIEIGLGRVAQKYSPRRIEETGRTGRQFAE